MNIPCHLQKKVSEPNTFPIYLIPGENIQQFTVQLLVVGDELHCFKKLIFILLPL